MDTNINIELFKIEQDIEYLEDEIEIARAYKERALLKEWKALLLNALAKRAAILKTIEL